MKQEPSILEPLFLAALAAAFVASLTTWAGAWITTLATGGTLDAGIVEGLPALIGYFRNPGDPAAAWGDPDVASPWLLYPVTTIIAIATIVVLFRIGNALWTRRSGFERRDRLGSSPEAALATKSDLAPIRAKFPLHGRFLLGVFGTMPLATEWRAKPGIRLSRKALRRQNDRGAVALVAPSRQGKSVLLIAGMLEWDGPLVVSSVKDDLIAPTLPHRRRQGQCAVFDPTAFITNAYRQRSKDNQVPGWDERLLVSWSPLAGITTFDDALASAKAVIDAAPSDGLGDDFWMKQVEMLLASLFWIAANSTGLGMKEIVTWVMTKDHPTGQGTNKDDGLVVTQMHYISLWTNHSDAAKLRYLKQCQEVLEGIWTDDEKTMSSVYATARTVITPWLGENTIAASQGPSVDLEWLVSGNNTLYLSAPPQDQRRLSPVFGGCINDLLEQAFNYTAIHGPIDPPLLIVLDEAGNMPLARLPEFVSTVAGLGIQLVTAWQSLAQIKAAYKDSADTVLTNHLTKMFFGAQSDSDALEYVSRLVGDEEVATASTTTDTYAMRSGSVQDASQRVPLTPANVLRQMEKFTALLIHGALPPAHVRIVTYFDTKRYAPMLQWYEGRSDIGLPRIKPPDHDATEREDPARSALPLEDAISHVTNATQEDDPNNGGGPDPQSVGRSMFKPNPEQPPDGFAPKPAKPDPSEQPVRQRQSLAAHLYHNSGDM